MLSDIATPLRSHIKCMHYLAAKEIPVHSTIKSTNKFLSTSLLSWNHVCHLKFLNNHRMFHVIGKKRLNIWNFWSPTQRQKTEERNKLSNCGRSCAGNYNPSYYWKLQPRLQSWCRRGMRTSKFLMLWLQLWLPTTT